MMKLSGVDEYLGVVQDGPDDGAGRGLHAVAD
jgi:hypothetical protein